MAKIYLITSGKGGTGKTTTAVNLGAAFNKFDENVAVVDTNLITPNIGLHFGAPIVPISFNHVLDGSADLEEAIYEHGTGIKVLPCSLSLKDLEEIDEKNMEKTIKQLKNFADHIFLDSAAGLGREVKFAINPSDEIIIVTNPNTLSVTDSLKAIKFAEDHGKKVRGIILTRVKNKKTEMSLETIEEMLEVPILGVVPEDKYIDEALLKKNSVLHTKPKSKAAQAYMDIAAKLLGKKKKRSLYNKVLKKIGLGY